MILLSKTPSTAMNSTRTLAAASSATASPFSQLARMDLFITQSTNHSTTAPFALLLRSAKTSTTTVLVLPAEVLVFLAEMTCPLLSESQAKINAPKELLSNHWPVDALTTTNAQMHALPYTRMRIPWTPTANVSAQLRQPSLGSSTTVFQIAGPTHSRQQKRMRCSISPIDACDLMIW